jgi:hypothetical protein
LGYIRESAQKDSFGFHKITDDSETADLVLFVEREAAAGAELEKVREHPIFQCHPEKCYVVNPRYKGIPYVPGIYASIRRSWYDHSRIRSGHYPEVRENHIFRDQGSVPEDGYLYSFRGKLATAPIRQCMSDLSHARGVIEDTTDENMTPMMKMRGIDSEVEAYMQHYVELIAASKFILCPRGNGPSSLRLFESMLMGRPPVIISDEWVPPQGPDWSSFSIRVPESKIKNIPRVLETKEDKAVEMGRKARAAWEAWFSPEVTFHRVVEWCLSIQATQPTFLGWCRSVRSFAYAYPPFRDLEHLHNRLRRLSHRLI